MTTEALRRHWALGLVVSLCTMAVLVAALALAPRTYTATSVVAMAPRPEARVSGDVLRLTMPTYAVLASSQGVAADLAGRFQEDPGDVRDAVSVDTPPSSNTLLLSVSWADPERAATLANGLADEVLEGVATDPLLTAQLVAPAVPATAPSWPPEQAGLLVGGLASVALGVAVAVFAGRRRPRASSAADVVTWIEEDDLTVPVLVTGRLATGTTTFTVRAVEDRLTTHGGTGAPQVDLVDAGEPGRAGAAVAVGVAAALARRGRTVCLCMSEQDRHFLGEPDLARELSSTAMGRVVVGSLAEGARPADSGRADELVAADLVVRLVRGTEHLKDWAPPKSLVGVLALVSEGIERRHVRATLEGLATAGAPVLAVCYLVSVPPESDAARR